ncbi:MAG: DUF4411 family protein, partial [Methanobrevibacter sp.]|nr:DUF4411 family protein [Candidatus Methanoflexus mossambicus]
MKYVVDTSAFLAGSKYDVYEKQYFQTYWENFDKLINSGIIVSTESVYDELIVKDDEMAEWAKTNKNMFKEIDGNILEYGNFLSKEFPTWYKIGTTKENWADPEVIAYAKLNNMILVTQEAWNSNAKADKKIKIPTICSQIGAYCHIRDKYDENINNHKSFQCIDLLELIK